MAVRRRFLFQINGSLVGSVLTWAIFSTRAHIHLQSRLEPSNKGPMRAYEVQVQTPSLFKSAHYRSLWPAILDRSSTVPCSLPRHESLSNTIHHNALNLYSIQLHPSAPYYSRAVKHPKSSYSSRCRCRPFDLTILIAPFNDI